jgi:hypothetical protein
VAHEMSVALEELVVPLGGDGSGSAAVMFKEIGIITEIIDSIMRSTKTFNFLI